ncbi:hypothetical protein DSL92_05365 [Billgrantia gudaonensis]|uniref:Uncharacterized protein n=1 Tax=Billgrantia gudaonensis TaxID=376427 RepID=A0A3S0R507_9GAMM|nr:hypothetical protein DSL92_05365 [Halomonas gudaonensis]
MMAFVGVMVNVQFSGAHIAPLSSLVMVLAIGGIRLSPLRPAIAGNAERPCSLVSEGAECIVGGLHGLSGGGRRHFTNWPRSESACRKPVPIFIRVTRGAR